MRKKVLVVVVAPLQVAWGADYAWPQDAMDILFTIWWGLSSLI